MKEFTQKLEKTTDFTFTTEKGSFVTLSVMKGSKLTAGKKKPYEYWMCELNVKGIDLQRNAVYYPEIDGCEEDEMGMHLEMAIILFAIAKMKKEKRLLFPFLLTLQNSQITLFTKN